MLEQWSLVEYSFQLIGIDLHDVWRTRSWRWFRTRLTGLLNDDTPIGRYFAPEPTTEVPDGG